MTLLQILARILAVTVLLAACLALVAATACFTALTTLYMLASAANPAAPGVPDLSGQALSLTAGSIIGWAACARTRRRP